MPRRPRIKLAGIPQHIVQRGVNREPCFFAEEDYHCYLHWLEKAAADWRCAIHAYVLMTNHVQPLGSEKFKDAVSAAAGVRRTRARRGRPEKASARGHVSEQIEFGF